MNRKLRVDYSNDAGEDDNAAPSNYQQQHIPPPSLPMIPQNNGYPPPPPLAQQATSTLPPLPLGVDLPPGLSCPDAISRTLNTLPPAQLLDVLSQMKTLATTDPSKAIELLNQAPQLSYAIFQALLLMGLVSTEALTSVVEAATTAPIPAPVPTPQQQYSAPGGFGTGYPPPPHMASGTPPVGRQGAYPAPPPPQPPAVQQQQLPDTEALVQQVLAMSQEVVDSLPPAEREQIMALRQAYGR